MIIVNSLGCPSSGKTSLSVGLFAKLKTMGLNVEFSQEVAKIWCYQGITINKYGQYIIFGEEVRQQSRLFGAVDILLSDSSPILSAFYNFYYNSGDTSLNEACKGFYKKVAEDNIQVLNFYLPRKKKYIQAGRYQTEKESDEVAEALQKWLGEQGYSYTYLDCSDEERVDVVFKKLEEVTGGFNGMFLV